MKYFKFLLKNVDKLLAGLMELNFLDSSKEKSSITKQQ
jgi:hypothetical protein